MNKIQLKNGVVEVYDTKEEIISVLSDKIGSNEVESIMTDSRYIGYFDANDDVECYIKSVVKIIANGKSSLFVLEHWNYKEDWLTEERTMLNIDVYTSGIAWIVFKRPDKQIQDTFIEYYNTVRNDDRIETILKNVKIGEKLYFKGDDNVLSSETVNYLELDCEEEFVVVVGTTKRKRKFAIYRFNNDGSYSTFDCDKYVYSTIDVMKKNCLEDLNKQKQKLKKQIGEIEKKIFDAMNFKN